MFGIFTHCAHLCKYRPCDSLLHRSRRPKNAGYSNLRPANPISQVTRFLCRRTLPSKLLCFPYFNFQTVGPFLFSYSALQLRLFSLLQFRIHFRKYRYESQTRLARVITSSVHRIAPTGTGQHRHSKNIEPCPVWDSKEQFRLSGGRKQIAT
jgi:hypothetical protein